MNFKLLIVTVCWIALAELCSSQDQIVKFPNSVHYSTNEDGNHVVTIDGVAAAPVRKKDPQDPLVFGQTPLDYIPSIPERISFKVDHEKLTCTLVTSRALKRSELSAAIDEIAKIRSDIPCWAELEARDLQRAVGFHDDRYMPEKVDGKVPSNLAWFWLLGTQGFSTSFVVEFGEPPGRLHIVPNVVPLGSESHYTIRILDHDGRILWSDTSTVHGPGRIAVADSDGDNRHEVYVESYNNEVAKFFHIKPRSEQAGRGDGDKPSK